MSEGPLGKPVNFVGDGGRGHLQLPGHGPVGAAGSDDCAHIFPFQSTFTVVMEVKSLQREGFLACFATVPGDYPMGLGGVASRMEKPLNISRGKEMFAFPIGAVGRDERIF